MFQRRDQQVSAESRRSSHHDPFESQVVGLRSAAGKDDFVAVSSQQRSNSITIRFGNFQMSLRCLQIGLGFLNCDGCLVLNGLCGVEFCVRFGLAGLRSFELRFRFFGDVWCVCLRKLENPPSPLPSRYILPIKARRG